MNNLKAIREAKGFTQQSLADKAGIAVQTVNRIENGKSKPHSSIIRVIAQALGCKPKELGF